MSKIAPPHFVSTWTQVEARLKNQIADAAPISGFLSWMEYQAALAARERDPALVQAVLGAVHYCSATGCWGFDEKAEVLIASLKRLAANEKISDGTERGRLELFFRHLIRLSV